MECKYCNNHEYKNCSGTIFFKELENTAGGDELTVSIGMVESGRYFLLVEYETSYDGFNADINYCPMCGRELKGGAGDE